MKHHGLEQLQLSHLLERFPHFVMVTNAEDIMIQRVNQPYQQLLGTRNVAGLSISEVFSGNDVDNLIKLLKKTIREKQPVHTGPLHANVIGSDGSKSRLIHTIVPIQG